MEAKAVVAQFMQTLAEAGTPERAVQEKRYLKSPMLFHGVTLPFINREAKAFYKANKDLETADLWAIVDGLWTTGYHDTRSLAIELLTLFSKRLVLGDVPRMEAMLRQSCTWDHVDEISARLGGALVDRYPEFKATLVAWSTDDYFWVRRASMLSQLVPLREGRGDLELFFRFAAAMIGEKEFFIRKAIGWILRDTARKRPEPVIAFVEKHVHEMAGLTFREALKHLSDAEQTRLKTLRG